MPSRFLLSLVMGRKPKAQWAYGTTVESIPWTLPLWVAQFVDNEIYGVGMQCWNYLVGGHSHLLRSCVISWPPQKPGSTKMCFLFTLFWIRSASELRPGGLLRWGGRMLPSRINWKSPLITFRRSSEVSSCGFDIYGYSNLWMLGLQIRKAFSTGKLLQLCHISNPFSCSEKTVVTRILIMFNFFQYILLYGFSICPGWLIQAFTYLFCNFLFKESHDKNFWGRKSCLCLI